MSEVFIVFVSKHSQACRAIKQQLDYISPYFNTRLIDIDNINVRKAVLNATKYKIESVPSIVLLYPSTGKIEKHEGQDVINLLNKGGVIGIDDYLMNKESLLDSPFSGVNYFLEKFKDKIIVLDKQYRVFIEKI